jgi:hypothetical protein
LQRAREWWDGHPPPEAGGMAVSDEDLERLKELGYLGESE